jgi:hypothetical protein
MNDFFQRLNLELIGAGVWGRTAGMLEQELRDHYLTEKAALVEQGKSDEEADRLALARLGDPVELAQKARLELDRRDGGLKRQILLRVVPMALGPASFAAFIVLLFLTNDIALPLFCPQSFPGGRPNFGWPPIQTEVLFFYLVPWLVIFLWVLRASYYPVYGWRCLMLLSGYLALSYDISAFWFMTLDDDFDLLFHPSRFMVLILFLSLLLLITPWRIRARKKGQAAKGMMLEA